MLRDLDAAGAQQATAVDCDVAVIGGGTAGALMAVELAARGLRCVVLESGGLRQAGDTHPLNSVVQTEQIYSGAEHGRFRCLGGTSTRWGGALLPFQPEDLGPHSAGWGAAWPVQLDDLLPYLPRIERRFALPPGPYETPDAVAPPSPGDFIVRAAKWPPFKLRNVARVCDAELRSAQGPEVWLNATVTRFTLGADSNVSAVEAVGSQGQRLTVRARAVVVAAGAIESTRLLLLLDAQHDERLFAGDGVIGRHFHDHLSARVADLGVRQPGPFRRLVGFRFERGAMRNTRFELSAAARRATRLPAAFAHVGFSTDGSTGFDGLREVLRALQRRELPSRRDLGLVAASSGWFARAGWWRFAHQRVLAPDEARYELHLVTEQQPAADNRIGLAHGERDRFGLPLATIAWRVSHADLAATEAVLDELARWWNASSLAGLATVERRPRAQWADELVSGGGIYHPGGTLRMAAAARDGVVDGRLRCFAVPNLRVVSTAAFPTGGGANPTLMLLLMALRAADEIATAARPR